MTKYYMMKVSREGVQLYGGRQEDKGSYTVFEDRNLKTVEEFCDINVTDSLTVICVRYTRHSHMP